jgi:hypothetical protein
MRQAPRKKMFEKGKRDQNQAQRLSAMQTRAIFKDPPKEK